MMKILAYILVMTAAVFGRAYAQLPQSDATPDPEKHTRTTVFVEQANKCETKKRGLPGSPR